MVKKLLCATFLLTTNIAFGINLLEPSIECTVIKVHFSEKMLGFAKFPVLYQSINNDPIKSRLLIGGREFPGLNPETLWKTETFEKISIHHGGGNLELELNGKPISRNGFLKENGKVLADVTCH